MKQSIAKQRLISLTKGQKIDLYRPEKIIQKISKQILLKVQKLMRQHPELNISEFLRFFNFILKPYIQQDDQFYLLYGLYRIFKQICRQYKTSKVSFSQLSTFITQKMPVTNQEVIVKQKLLPIGLSIPKQQKAHIIAPQILGKMIHQRQFLDKTPYQFDKFQHVNRCIAQTCYSSQSNLYMSIDLPSNYIKVLDKNFSEVANICSELQISKKQSVISYIAWSESQGRLGAILGNYSISYWSKEDNFRFQVNVPLPPSNLSYPFVCIGYMESIKTWYAIDNRPVVHILSSRNFEPIHQIKNFKMIKQKSTQKIFTLEMKYQKLLCIGFQRKIFLLSLETRQVITQLTNFATSITSLAFSQTYQALFVSNYEIYFKAFQLTQFCDLTQKGRFEGHKHQIVLLGTLQKKAVVYSLEQNWIIKLWDVRDFTCYQTFSVLKNISYLQMFTVNGGVCLTGSKLYLYRWISQKNQSSKALINQNIQQKQSQSRIIFLTHLDKNLIIVSSQTIKIFSYHSGSLLKVVKGLYQGEQLMTFAYLNQAKKQLYISNEDGNFIILETQNFSKIHQFTFLPQPVSISYSQKQDIITFSAMGEINIMQAKHAINYQVKRRIYNQKQKVKICKVYPLHDLITVIYKLEEQNQRIDSEQSQLGLIKNLYFYSFQKGKLIGFHSTQNLSSFQIHPTKNILIIVQNHKVKIYSFQKNSLQIKFILHNQIKLWSGQLFYMSLTYEFKTYVQSNNQPVKAKAVILFEKIISIVSNYSCLFCNILIDFESIFTGKVQRDYTQYNPYRISVESHCEAMNFLYSSNQVCDKSFDAVQIHSKYFQTKAFAQTQEVIKLGNLFGILNSKNDIHFFDHITFSLLGVINTELTLPKMWNMYCYEQSQLQDIQFVVKFMQNEQRKLQQSSPTKHSTQIFQLTMNKLSTLSPQRKKSKVLTVQKILQNTLSPILNSSSMSPNNFSLRQRKLMLQKQRQEKQRLQNFIQHQEQEELNKLRSYHSQDNQANINETLGFFAINRNQTVKNRGIKHEEFIKIKLLQRKLENSVKKDDKKGQLSVNLSEHLVKNQQKNKNLKDSDIFRLKNSSRMGNLSKPKQQKNQYKTGFSMIRIVDDSLSKLSNQSPYNNKNLNQISNKKMFLRILDEQVKKSKLSRGQMSQRKLKLRPSLQLKADDSLNKLNQQPNIYVTLKSRNISLPILNRYKH